MTLFPNYLKSMIIEENMNETNDYIGSNFEDFLKEEGIFEEVIELSIEEIAAWKNQLIINRLKHITCDI